ncbi:MAG: CheB methylesterase domain-containing protein [Defluviitaleaceae bacterium]|nr:CheB methylesterase domain-containing protein [Defluviitaleaceae bacterium]
MLAGGINLIAIGASTGGFDALEAILSQFPADAPPVVIAMHLKPGIPKLFASRLNGISRLVAKEAETGDVLKAGHVFIAPGWMHMTVINRAGRLEANCFSGEKVNHVAPSADVLFESAAIATGKNAVGVILTGIGADGADGLLKMRASGAVTIGQNEDTCMVYGMPRVAKERGAVMHELPLDKIADKILTT